MLQYWSGGMAKSMHSVDLNDLGWSTGLSNAGENTTEDNIVAVLSEHIHIDPTLRVKRHLYRRTAPLQLQRNVVASARASAPSLGPFATLSYVDAEVGAIRPSVHKNLLSLKDWWAG